MSMPTCPRSLQIGILPGAAIGGLLGGVVITSLARRLSAPQTRRGLFVRRRGRRPCARCAGFGISRCPLCAGEGICMFSAKVKQQIPCPLCVMRRYVPCDMCSGSGLRLRASGPRAALAKGLMAARRCVDAVRLRLLGQLGA